METWRPIDTYQEDYGKAVLVYCPANECSYTAFWSGCYWEHFTSPMMRLESQPSHWMPIPADPVVVPKHEPTLLEAIKKLSFAAQTSGGTAGRDEGLCAAIAIAADAIAREEAKSAADEKLREALRAFIGNDHLETRSWHGQYRGVLTAAIEAGIVT